MHSSRIDLTVSTEPTYGPVTSKEPMTMTSKTTVKTTIEMTEEEYNGRAEAIVANKDGLKFLEVGKAIIALEKEKVERQKEVASVAKAATSALVEKNRGLADAFKVEATKVLEDAWRAAGLADSLGRIPMPVVKSLTFRVTREESGTVGAPVILVGEPKRGGGGGGGGGNGGSKASLTVDGHVYASASEARRAILKTDTPMSRKSTMAAIKVVRPDAVFGEELLSNVVTAK